jgi:hypothetical protein
LYSQLFNALSPNLFPYDRCFCFGVFVKLNFWGEKCINFNYGTFFFYLFSCIKIATLCTGYSISCCTAINTMVVERCSSISECSDPLSMVVANVGDHGLKGKNCIEETSRGKTVLYEHRCFGTPCYFKCVYFWTLKIYRVWQKQVDN